MKVYVQVENKRFNNIEDAVAAFNDTDIEQFDIDVYDAETEEMELKCEWCYEVDTLYKCQILDD